MNPPNRGKNATVITLISIQVLLKTLFPDFRFRFDFEFEW